MPTRQSPATLPVLGRSSRHAPQIRTSVSTRRTAVFTLADPLPSVAAPLGDPERLDLAAASRPALKKRRRSWCLYHGGALVAVAPRIRLLEHRPARLPRGLHASSAWPVHEVRSGEVVARRGSSHGVCLDRCHNVRHDVGRSSSRSTGTRRLPRPRVSPSERGRGPDAGACPSDARGRSWAYTTSRFLRTARSDRAAACVDGESRRAPTVCRTPTVRTSLPATALRRAGAGRSRARAPSCRVRAAHACC